MYKYLLLLLLNSFLMFGQKGSYAKFSLKHFSKIKHFNIILTGNSTEKKVSYLHIYCPSKENTSDLVNLSIEGEKIKEFKENLKNAKKKYTELKKFAIKNNFKNFTKQIKKINQPIHNAVFKKKTCKGLDNNVSLYYNFKVKNGKYLLFIENFRLISVSDKSIKSKGLSLVFTNTEEISNFINLINQKKMIDYILSNSKK